MAIPRQAIAGPVGGSGLSLPHHQDDKYYIGYAVRRQPTAPSDSCPQTLKTISDHLPMHRGVLVMLTGIPFPTAPHWRNSRIQSTPPGCCAVALPPPCAGGCLRRPATNCTMRGIPVSTVPHWINWRNCSQMLHLGSGPWPSDRWEHMPWPFPKQSAKHSPCRSPGRCPNKSNTRLAGPCAGLPPRPCRT